MHCMFSQCDHPLTRRGFILQMIINVSGEILCYFIAENVTLLLVELTVVRRSLS